MTKLTEWLSVLLALFTVWINLYIYQTDIPYLKDKPKIILLAPFVLLFTFALYAITVVLYRVLTFNNCEEAAKDLQKVLLNFKSKKPKGIISTAIRVNNSNIRKYEIEEAKSDLSRLGFHFKTN